MVGGWATTRTAGAEAVTTGAGGTTATRAAGTAAGATGETGVAVGLRGFCACAGPARVNRDAANRIVLDNVCMEPPRQRSKGACGAAGSVSRLAAGRLLASTAIAMPACRAPAGHG